jgi:hypothetical protein
MVSIFIDTSSISNSFNLSDRVVADMVDYTIKEITARFAQEWENEANRVLKSSRSQYINSIVVVDEGFARGYVMLVGEHPNAIENGFEPFDMKPGLLNGPNSKTTKAGGRYNVVPFSMGTPGALEENFNGGIMPQEVYEVIKEKPAENYLPGGGKASKPLTLEEIPEQFQQPQVKSVRVPGSKAFQDYQHKHSIYEGLRKVEDPTTGQNRYQSFRAVSTSSDPLSWIHPGVEAKKIADKVLTDFNIPAETGRAVDKFLSSM